MMEIETAMQIIANYQNARHYAGALASARSWDIRAASLKEVQWAERRNIAPDGLEAARIIVAMYIAINLAEGIRRAGLPPDDGRFRIFPRTQLVRAIHAPEEGVSIDRDTVSVRWHKQFVEVSAFSPQSARYYEIVD